MKKIFLNLSLMLMTLTFDSCQQKDDYITIEYAGIDKKEYELDVINIQLDRALRSLVYIF